MIIWTGHGILIPVLAFAGLALGFGAGQSFGGTDSDRGNGVAMVVAGVASSSLVWLYALTLGKTVAHRYLDPKTRQVVTVARRHTLYFIPAFAWAVIFTGIGLVSVASGIHSLVSASPAETGPGSREFAQANERLAAFQGTVAFGNTLEAEALAEAFAATAKELRAVLIEAATAPSYSLTEGQFLSYCQVSPHGAAFLLHVPDLSKFDDSAKEAMAEGAWLAANSVLAGQELRPPNLAVGVRGSLSFEAFLCGVPSGGDATDGDALSGIRSRHPARDKEVVFPYFAPTEADAPIPWIPLEFREGGANPPAPSDVGSDAKGTTEEPEAARPGKPEGAAPGPPATGDAAPPEPMTPMPPVLPTEERDWTAADGRVMKAALLRFPEGTEETPEFRRADGATFVIPLDRFSPESVAEIRELFSQSRKAP